MRQIYPDLWQTSPERPIPDTPEATSHAYLLLRDGGNILFYGTGREEGGSPKEEDDLRRIQNLGGISHQILAHWHEAAPSLAHIREMFGSKLCCHERDASDVARIGKIEVDQVFRRAETALGDIEVIPTPGHTAGSTCFLYRSPHGKTYLFSGDTIVPARDSWLSAALGGSKADLRNSLELLRNLKPDAVMAAGALGPDTYREIASPAVWQAAIEATEQALS
ncbi:MBL fold metallo-hydrolase [Nitratireductor sp. GCM10026969]|uniref:MBL fold metallo-hydrolase n=1 Tax=Nitratireductor sp. GCM10026969 TaxID=3252645 RepID=UPI003618EF21